MEEILPYKGLTEAEACSQLKQVGPNEILQSKRANYWIRSSQLVREPMILLLIAAATIYLIVGDLGEGLLLVASAFVVIGISVYQERKSERALEALRQLSSPRALVIRDGVARRVAAMELVPGDLILLHEGDRVPADGLILQASNLSADESLLTGESFPAKKTEFSKGGHQDAPFESISDRCKVFSSTLVVSGTATVRVLQTGMQTEVGKIGKGLQEIEPEELNLAREIRQIVRLFAWTGLIICGILVVLYGVTRGDWLQAILIGLATEMALLPEEFPVVLTLFMAMGAWRLSKTQVLVRRAGAIERLGAASVLCVDKTGTLTENRMSVSQLGTVDSTFRVGPKSKSSLPDEFREVIEYGVLASHVDPFDPMEKAIRRLLEEGSWGKDHVHRDWRLVRDYPLSEKLLAMSSVWMGGAGTQYVVAAKGAPEAVVDLCHLPLAKTEHIKNSVKQMAALGLRVIGVAKALFPQTTLPTDQHDFAFEWVGLIGLEDPLRPEVPDAVRICRNAGIRVIMMTGDYPETALKIAQQAGIDANSSIIHGSELQTLSDKELLDRLKNTHVFARTVPGQKLRIVKALKKMGYIVAMTGDGVNDAPSLKWADIGIAMGARGTDVAREAADMVLLDDNFASIVAGIERGRIIFENIRKAMSYIASIHVPIAGLAVLPVLGGWPIILYPAHIVFLELIIDPACSLMFESQRPTSNLMSRPPRELNRRLFTLRDFMHSFSQGFFIFVVTALTFGFALTLDDGDPARARSLTFNILVMCNIGLIFADISGGSIRVIGRLFKNVPNLLIIIGIFLSLLAGIQIPWFSKLFQFSRLTGYEILISVSISLAVFAIVCAWNWAVENRLKV